MNPLILVYHLEMIAYSELIYLFGTWVLRVISAFIV